MPSPTGAGKGKMRIEHGYQGSFFSRRPQLLRSLEGDQTAKRPTRQQVRPIDAFAPDFL